MNYTEELYCYSLSRALMLEPLAARAIVDNLGSAEAFFSLSAQEKEQIIGPHNRLHDKIMSANAEKYAQEFESLLAQGYRYIAHNDPLFPQEFCVCDNAPIGLFISSTENLENLFRKPMIAVVGTRDISNYGKAWCENIVRALAECTQKPTIVSGLAYGVDITAHRTALECGLPTIAVLGTGITNIYPGSHVGTAKQIVNTPCSGVISEYGLGLPNAPLTFLGRNRIIAALADATILVESKIKGGGMTTARLAASYNKDVYALPGRIDDIRSQGCNYLIKSNVAAPIIGCMELVESLGYMHAPQQRTGRMECREYYKGSLDSRQIERAAAIIAEVASGHDISVREIAGRTGIDFSEVLSLAGRLESDGFISIDMFQQCNIRRN